MFLCNNTNNNYLGYMCWLCSRVALPVSLYPPCSNRIELPEKLIIYSINQVQSTISIRFYTRLLPETRTYAPKVMFVQTSPHFSLYCLHRLGCITFLICYKITSGLFLYYRAIQFRLYCYVRKCGKHRGYFSYTK